MEAFNVFTTTGRISEIGDIQISPSTGFRKKTFTISSGKGKSIHLALHYQDTKQLEGFKKEDMVIVEFVIKGKILKNGNKINNLIAQKVMKI